MISLSDPDRGADDINAQLWRAQMPNFEYIMVEGFKIEDMSEEEVQVEVDKIVDYLQRRLRTNSEDYIRFARLSESDARFHQVADGIEEVLMILDVVEQTVRYVNPAYEALWGCASLTPHRCRANLRYQQ